MSIQQQFEALGGQFLRSEQDLQDKLKDVRAFVFDWDGVFNTGTKSNVQGSSFSEPDSMGINMLRFSYWLIHHHVPPTFIVTGENNQTAVLFAEREHFDAVLLGAKNKGEALTELGKEHHLTPAHMAFVFDDILDLSAAAICGLSLCVNRPSSPLFNEYLIKNKLCDYISGSTGGRHAVREITELLIGLNGNYDATISKRMAYNGEYMEYLAERSQKKPVVWKQDSK